MGKIYDLTQKQQELKDRLYWCDDGEEKELLEMMLGKCQNSAMEVINYLCGIMLESDSELEAIKDAKRKTMESFDSRIKRNERTKELLKEKIANTMKEFDIDAVQCDYRRIKLLKDSESIFYGDAYSVSNLPENCVKTEIKQTPIAAEIKKCRDENPDKFFNDVHFAGITWVKKPSIKVT